MTDDIQHDEQTEPSPDGESMDAQIPESPWEKELDVYPLRAPEDDPRWAMWVFWIWSVICVSMLAFLIVLTVLGWFYD